MWPRGRTGRLSVRWERHARQAFVGRFGTCTAHLRLLDGAGAKHRGSGPARPRDRQRRCVWAVVHRHDQQERRNDAPPPGPAPSYVRYTPSSLSRPAPARRRLATTAPERHCATQSTTRNRMLAWASLTSAGMRVTGHTPAQASPATRPGTGIAHLRLVLGAFLLVS